MDSYKNRRGLRGNYEIKKLFPKDMKYIEALPIANYIEQLQQENKQLKEQLEQRDEVIDETIAFCNYLLENNEVEIDNEKYFKHSCDDIITNAILTRLQKYKGDSDE